MARRQRSAFSPVQAWMSGLASAFEIGADYRSAMGIGTAAPAEASEVWLRAGVVLRQNSMNALMWTVNRSKCCTDLDLLPWQSRMEELCDETARRQVACVTVELENRRREMQIQITRSAQLRAQLVEMKRLVKSLKPTR